MQGPFREEFRRIFTRALLCENLQWKCRGPRAWEPRSAPAQSKCTTWTSHKSNFLARTYRKRCRARTLCACLRSQNWYGHLKNNFTREFSGKKLGPKIEPKLRPSLCASLRDRNAHRHRTEPLLCENVQQKFRAPESVPWSNPALTPTARTPQCGHTVWEKDHTDLRLSACRTPSKSGVVRRTGNDVLDCRMPPKVHLALSIIPKVWPPNPNWKQKGHI